MDCIEWGNEVSVGHFSVPAAKSEPGRRGNLFQRVNPTMKLLLGVLLGFYAGLGVVPAFAEEKPVTKGKVLLIGKQPDHPYGSHMYLHTCRMLGECLRLN